MTQENTKRVEIDVLALLHKLWTKKVFILFTAFYVAVFAFLGTYFLIHVMPSAKAATSSSSKSPSTFV